jgi:hypothetical protein
MKLLKHKNTLDVPHIPALKKPQMPTQSKERESGVTQAFAAFGGIQIDKGDIQVEWYKKEEDGARGEKVVEGAEEWIEGDEARRKLISLQLMFGTGWGPRDRKILTKEYPEYNFDSYSTAQKELNKKDAEEIKGKYKGKEGGDTLKGEGVGKKDRLKMASEVIKKSDVKRRPVYDWSGIDINAKTAFWREIVEKWGADTWDSKEETGEDGKRSKSKDRDGEKEKGEGAKEGEEAGTGKKGKGSKGTTPREQDKNRKGTQDKGQENGEKEREKDKKKERQKEEDDEWSVIRDLWWTLRQEDGNGGHHGPAEEEDTEAIKASINGGWGEEEDVRMLIRINKDPLHYIEEELWAQEPGMVKTWMGKVRKIVKDVCESRVKRRWVKAKTTHEGEENEGNISEVGKGPGTRDRERGQTGGDKTEEDKKERNRKEREREREEREKKKEKERKEERTRKETKESGELAVVHNSNSENEEDESAEERKARRQRERKSRKREYDTDSEEEERVPKKKRRGGHEYQLEKVVSEGQRLRNVIIKGLKGVNPQSVMKMVQHLFKRTNLDLTMAKSATEGAGYLHIWVDGAKWEEVIDGKTRAEYTLDDHIIIIEEVRKEDSWQVTNKWNAPRSMKRE